MRAQCRTAPSRQAGGTQTTQSTVEPPRPVPESIPVPPPAPVDGSAWIPARALLAQSALALVLTVSASLHIHQPGQPWHTAYGTAIGLWAGWTIGGWLPIWTRRVNLLLVGCFIGVLIHRLATGAADCGCFPGISLPPWLTLLLDAGLLVLLWRGGPGGGSHHRPAMRRTVATVITLWVIGLASLTTWQVQRSRHRPWEPPLDQGRWRMVVVREGCEHCHAALTWLIPIANQEPRGWAFASASGQPGWLRRLGLDPAVPVSQRFDPWQDTPTGLHLRDGKVVGTFAIPNQAWEEE